MDTRSFGMQDIRMKSGLFAIAGILVATSAMAGYPGLLNTGVDSSGAPLAVGSADSHYSLVGPLSDPVAVERHRSPTLRYNWVEAPAGSAWIGPAETGVYAPRGNYTYTIHFDLTGQDPGSVVLTGDFASDNKGRIVLNGKETGYENSEVQYRALTSFTISSGFVAGMNTLEFCTTNGPGLGRNPTGLLVANLKLAGKESELARILAAARNASASTPAAVTSPSTAPLPADPNFGYALPTEVGLTHEIEFSPDLTNWSPATNTVFYFRDLDSTNYSQGYYRFRKK